MFHKGKWGQSGSVGRADQDQLVCGTLLDGLNGQIHEHGGFIIADPVNFACRYPHLFAGKAVAGLDDQLRNRPAQGVHHKITDMADSAITCLDVVAVYGLRAPQMGIGAFGGTATPRVRLTR